MIANQTVLAVICARGGSKGLPGKNIRPLAGRPLIAWSVAAAREATLVDRVVVSTDDDAIAQAARDAGAEVPFRRPPELASDTASVTDAVLHAVDQLGGDFGYVVLLQATSPLRTGADIDACIRLCHDSGAPAAATVCEVSKSPFWMFTLGTDLRVRRLLDSHPIGNRRQNLPKVYAANGAVYVARPDWLRAAGTFWTDETAGHVMPAERSVDVDSELDFKLAQLLLEG